MRVISPVIINQFHTKKPQHSVHVVGALIEDLIVKHLSVLAPTDSVRLDQNKLAELFIQMGPKEAENTVCRVMEELALRLSVLDSEHAKGDKNKIAKDARGLIGMAVQIGLTDLATVAGHVEQCFRGNDHVAQQATLSRLFRVADKSLSEVWESQDMTL